MEQLTADEPYDSVSGAFVTYGGCVINLVEGESTSFSAILLVLVSAHFPTFIARQLFCDFSTYHAGDATLVGAIYSPAYDDRKLQEVSTLFHLQHQHVVCYYQTWVETDVAGFVVGGTWDYRTAVNTLLNGDKMETTNNIGFAWDINAQLDRDLMNSILGNGHSRLSVYYEEPTNIIGLVLVKNLLTVHPEDEVPVKSVTIRRIPRVPETMPLYDILNEFLKGHSHMAVVVRQFNKPTEQSTDKGPADDSVKEVRVAMNVAATLNCLPMYDPTICWKEELTAPFGYVEIQDFAYVDRTRLATPSMVGEQIMALEDFKKSNSVTPFFISYNAEDGGQQVHKGLMKKILYQFWKEFSWPFRMI
ncbi:hypothetical protein Nepgr_013372 [Nepenthes gracilis]|uniref:Uncharacterized protein n=1 Tax=Nepenthes gracilis TaxID=150966 RepID=A0AAD3SJG0_NEPGR|nr:hypothetical protein Nepgr_013372 [Nepenthes gracilis]